MKIRDVLQLSGSAMNAQSTRLRVIAENIANSETLDDGKGAPYRRKLTVLQAELSRRDDMRRVTVRGDLPVGLDGRRSHVVTDPLLVVR